MLKATFLQISFSRLLLYISQTVQKKFSTSFQKSALYNHGTSIKKQKKYYD